MPAPEQGKTRQGHRAWVNGLNIYYEERGRGLPLLLIDAGVLTGDSLQPYLAGLASEY